MNIFLARQPIFDRNQNVFAYELLYRDGTVNAYTGRDGDAASSNVILNSFGLVGLENLTGGKKAFINFTSELIRQGVATLFPKDQLVIELLESIAPDRDIIESCREIKKKGYCLALDDFVFQEAYLPLIELADIIKIDFMNTSPDGRKNIVKFLGNGRIRFLAEKIETLQEYEQAREYGYTYFQGYFFSKPDILSAKDISPLKMNYLQLIRQVNDPDMDFDKISDIVIRDVSLSYKLLKLVNSAAFGFRNRITSIKHALVILGVREIRKWVSLIALKGINEGQPHEVIQLSLVRARFCEQLAKCMNMSANAQELFLVGLFSCLDVLMNRPMDEIIQTLYLPDGVRQALVQKTGPYGEAYQMVLSYEKADWDAVSSTYDSCHVRSESISESYMEAIQWVDRLNKDMAVS